MAMNAEIPNARPPRRWLRSIGAVLAGLVVVIVLSTGADAVLDATGVYPPAGEPMTDPKLYALALAYRCVFTVMGGWVTARLAPASPGKHVLVLAGIGLVLGSLGVVAALATNLGPAWYAIAVAVTGPLCTVLGGAIQTTVHKG
jgi:hypothetical protein